MSDARVIQLGKENEAQHRARLAKEYKVSKEFADAAAKRADELKQMLLKDLKEKGVPDDRGHKWCPAGDFQLKHERRVTTKFDLDAAAEWAKENDLWDEIKDVIEVPNEEKILALGWTNPELSDTIASFYKQSETWAFKLVEQRSYDDE